MTAQIIDGKAIAEAKIEALKTAITEHKQQGLSTPCLATILVGDNPASEIYVRNKIEACGKAGMLSEKHQLSADTSEDELCQLIEKLNNNDAVHGILVQLPLPKHIDSGRIIETIKPEKDVDGFHPYNLGRLAQRKPLLRPCTPYGVIQLLETINADLDGKHAVIVGASNIVGRPMALELLMKHCTITICHSSTKDLAEHVKQADLLVSAVGKPKLIKGDWIKEGAIVIDIGINRLESGKLCGDIEFEVAKEKAAFITPVPGGVGPMTVATLLQNTLLAAE